MSGSFNRLDYDKCAYAKFVEESTEPLDYLMYQGKHINDTKCGEHPNMLEIPSRVGGESELRNLDRLASKCPSKKFFPNDKVEEVKATNPKICERIPSGLTQDFSKLVEAERELVCGMKR